MRMGFALGLGLSNSVTDTAHGFNYIGPELFAQVVDMHFNSIAGNFLAPAVKLVFKTVTGQHLARIGS